jgi:predicted DNA-binding antitoxin AbrB/MazE fold protein
MKKNIHAIYENGVFRPLGQVDLPDQTEVEFTPRPVSESPNGADLDKTYEILSESFDTDITDLAEKHNEHQP